MNDAAAEPTAWYSLNTVRSRDGTAASCHRSVPGRPAAGLPPTAATTVG